MNPHTAMFLIVITLFIGVAVGLGVFSIVQMRRKSAGRWEDIVKRLKPMNRDRIEEVAFDIINPSGERRTDDESATLDAAQIWSLIGEWNGLETIRHNCSVLIDLAFYVQQWYPEALAVAEQLRLNAREIEWHISRLRTAQANGKLETVIPMYAQKAVATYYVMTRRVLALYEQGNVTMLAELQHTL